jgi:hypothetical protein
MPKLQNRFRVTFVINGGTLITGNVVSATRPTLTFPEIAMDVYNSKIYMPGKHEWNSINIVMRDDVDSTTVTAIDRQLNQQIDMQSQSVARSASAFKFTTRIETLDGTNGSPIGDTDLAVLDTWDLAGCFIQNVEYGNNDYSASEPVTISVTLRYDNAAHTIRGNDQLSGEFTQTQLSAATGGGS